MLLRMQCCNIFVFHWPGIAGTLIVYNFVFYFWKLEGINVLGVFSCPDWYFCLLVYPVSECLISRQCNPYFVIFHCFFLFCRALKAGSQIPLLVTIAGDTFPNAWSVSALGALHALYVVSIIDHSLSGIHFPAIDLIRRDTIANHRL